MARKTFDLPGKVYNTFAITISPPYSKGKPEYLYNNVRDTLRTKFRRCSNHYCLYPEFSDTSRLHFHGVIRFKDKVKFDMSIKSYIDLNIGFVCIKPICTIIEHIRWIQYCKKGGFNYEPIMPKHKPRKHKIDLDYLDEDQQTPIERWASR